MRKKEWIGDVCVIAGWNRYTDKREWRVWMPCEFRNRYISKEDGEVCYICSTKPEAMREAKRIAKKRENREEIEMIFKKIIEVLEKEKSQIIKHWATISVKMQNYGTGLGQAIDLIEEEKRNIINNYYTSGRYKENCV